MQDSAKVSQALTDSAHHASPHKSRNGPMVTASSNKLREVSGWRYFANTLTQSRAAFAPCGAAPAPLSMNIAVSFFVLLSILNGKNFATVNDVAAPQQAKALPKRSVFLYAPAICDVRPAPGRMQRIGGGGNGAAMQKEDMAGAMGAST